MTLTTHAANDAREWIPDPDQFPSKGSVEDALRFCLQYAVLAPSGHNTQPWWFAIEDNTVTIGLDVSRGLAVADPEDREGIISVGAAVLVLRVALAHFGLSVHVDDWPDPLDPEACARVTALYGGPVDVGLEPLFEAITARRTSRQAFDSAEVDPTLTDVLAAEATAEGATVHVFVDNHDRDQLAALVADADRHQMADPRFRRELASWLRRPGSRQRDGLHGYTLTSPLEQVALASPLIVRTFDTGAHRAAHDHDLATGSPVMLVISSVDDDRTTWLHVGQALARLLLHATRADLSVGFLNQAVEVAETRDALALILGDETIPQLLLRVGYGPEVGAQPRRPLDRSLLD